MRAIPEKRDLQGTPDCSLVIRRDDGRHGTAGVQGLGSNPRGSARHGAAEDQPGLHAPAIDRQGRQESRELALEEARNTSPCASAQGALDAVTAVLLLPR